MSESELGVGRSGCATGHCDMVATRDGSTLYICDSVAEVQARPFLAPPTPADGPEMKWSAGDDEARALAVGGKDGAELVVAGEDGQVRQYAVPSGELQRVVLELPTPVNHVAISDTLIAVAAEDDAQITLERNRDPTDIMKLRGHQSSRQPTKLFRSGARYRASSMRSMRRSG